MDKFTAITNIGSSKNRYVSKIASIPIGDMYKRSSNSFGFTFLLTYSGGNKCYIASLTEKSNQPILKEFHFDSEEIPHTFFEKTENSIDIYALLELDNTCFIKVLASNLFDLIKLYHYTKQIDKSSLNLTEAIIESSILNSSITNSSIENSSLQSIFKKGIQTDGENTSILFDFSEVNSLRGYYKVWFADTINSTVSKSEFIYNQNFQTKVIEKTSDNVIPLIDATKKTLTFSNISKGKIIVEFAPAYES